MVPPGFSAPERSAASIMRRAMRSLTEPPGLKYSTLARTVAWSPLVTLFSFTSGVFPTRSTMDSAYFIGGVSRFLLYGGYTAALYGTHKPTVRNRHDVANRPHGKVAQTADILQLRLAG